MIKFLNLIMIYILLFNLSVSALEHSNRPEEAQKLIDKTFDSLSKSNSNWIYGGSRDYVSFGVYSVDFLLHLLQTNPTKKEFFILDLGAGKFQWGQGVADFIEKQDKINNDVTIHVFSVTAENFGNTEIKKSKNCIIYNISKFKLENLEEELKRILREVGLSESSYFDLIVSQWTFLHLVDPVGTFVQAYNRLRPTIGLMLMHGFPIFFEADDAPMQNELDLDDSVVSLLANVKAPFLVHKSMGSDSSYRQFLLSRIDNQPLQLALSYGTLREKQYSGTDNWVSKIHYKIDNPIRWHRKFRPLITDSNRVQGSVDLYKSVYQNIIDWQVRLMAWSPLFVDDTQEPIIPERDPLFKAAVDNDDLAKTKEIIESGKGSVNQKDVRGYPLVCSNLSIDILQYILARNEIPKNIICSNGNSPLNYEARNNNPEKMRVLINYGFIANHTNDLGDTPLHDLINYNKNILSRIVKYNHIPENMLEFKKLVRSINLLISESGDASAQNKKGKKPFDTIKENELLIEALRSNAPELMKYIE